jgi:tetratricopeptide (TPR) repeat protein
VQQALLWLRQRDLASASLAAREALYCLRTDAVQQAQWLRGLVHGAHSLALAALVTMTVLLLVRTLFFAQHLVDDRAGNAPATLLALAFVLLTAAWQAPLAALLVVLLVLVPFLARGERRVLGVLCVALALCEAPVPLLATRAMLLDPGAAGARLAQAQSAGSDARLERSLLREIAPGRERDLVLGLLARRRGDLATAERHYAAAIAADPNWSTPYVNLANVYFIQGDMQRAAAGYRKAQSLDADNAFAAANLAQTYIRMLHFGEADQELARAAGLDFGAVTRRRAAWLDTQLPVLDMLLAPAEVLRLAGDEVRANPRQAQLLLQTWRGTAWSGLGPWQAAAVLLALSMLLWSRWRLRGLAYECANCTRLVCAHCTRESRTSAARVCPYCDLNAPRIERLEAIDPEAPPRPRPRRRAPPTWPAARRSPP